MATYRHPRAQDTKWGAFWVMAKDFDSGKYDKYIIQEEGTDKVYTFKHEKIVKHLKSNPGDRDTRTEFAQGKPFIRLRLHLAEKENE